MYLELHSNLSGVVALSVLYNVSRTLGYSRYSRQFPIAAIKQQERKLYHLLFWKAIKVTRLTIPLHAA